MLRATPDLDPDDGDIPPVARAAARDFGIACVDLEMSIRRGDDGLEMSMPIKDLITSYTRLLALSKKCPAREKAINRLTLVVLKAVVESKDEQLLPRMLRIACSLGSMREVA